MRWQRRLKRNFSCDQTLFLVTRPRHGSRLLRASFAGRRISRQSQTEELPPNRNRSFLCRAQRLGELQVYANRRRVNGSYGKHLLRKRGELIERSFAHCYDTGGMRRTHLRGHKNILKRLLIHVGAFNLSLIFRSLLGAGTPRELRNRLARLFSRLFGALCQLMMHTERGNSVFSPLGFRSQRNRRYLRYRLRHSKEPASATDC